MPSFHERQYFPSKNILICQVRLPSSRKKSSTSPPHSILHTNKKWKDAALNVALMSFVITLSASTFIRIKIAKLYIKLQMSQFLSYKNIYMRLWYLIIIREPSNFESRQLKMKSCSEFMKQNTVVRICVLSDWGL